MLVCNKILLWNLLQMLLSASANKFLRLKPQHYFMLPFTEKKDIGSFSSSNSEGPQNQGVLKILVARKIPKASFGIRIFWH